MDVKKISRISILVAIAVVSRFAFAQFPNIKPITALFLVTIVFWGIYDSIIVMILTMIITGIYMGMSIMVLFQIISFAVIMIIWNLTYKYMTKIVYQMILAGIVTMLYGLIISLFSTYIFSASFWPFYMAGLGFDMMHAVSTVIFYPLIYNIFERFKI
ncbi:hypothetical protein BG262_07500 [Floricoccus penangensis]|uniref:ECF transporter S component n=1 Tax=Floricoccus penangensis TaxID=1859475 RepID=A0A9Q5JEI0_9LACT|nr:hypothetical protein [Floricoccus penangensis]OFI45835.1 hypothetical protein BG262_07500 [Floricoccus penangensis]